jgi:hypothetical protein
MRDRVKLCDECLSANALQSARLFGKLTVYDPKFEVRISSLMGEIFEILPRIEASHTNGGYRGFEILEGPST